MSDMNVNTDAKGSEGANVNPTKAITPPKMAHRELRVLTSEEQGRFMNVLERHRLEALFKLALATGMRKGELFALTWENVDFVHGKISISKTAKWVRNKETSQTEIIVGNLKSKTGYREILMSPPVVSILSKHYLLQQKERREAGPSYNQLGLVFCSTAGTYIEPHRINTALEKLLKQAGVENINFHALRHTFAARALEYSIPAKAIRKIHGHVGISPTLNTYTHVLKEALIDKTGKMGNRTIRSGEKNKEMKEQNTER